MAPLPQSRHFKAHKDGHGVIEAARCHCIFDRREERDATVSAIQHIGKGLGLGQFQTAAIATSRRRAATAERRLGFARLEIRLCRTLAFERQRGYLGHLSRFAHQKPKNHEIFGQMNNLPKKFSILMMPLAPTFLPRLGLRATKGYYVVWDLPFDPRIGLMGDRIDVPAPSHRHDLSGVVNACLPALCLQVANGVGHARRGKIVEHHGAVGRRIELAGHGVV
jgi:hypothetical protein